MLTQGYAAFAELALAERDEARWPPTRTSRRGTPRPREREPAFAFLDRVSSAASRIAKTRRHDVEILGPAPQAMERKDGRYRARLMYAERAARRRCTSRERQMLLEVREMAEARKVRWSIDIDPLEL